MRILLCTGFGGGNIPPLASIAGELVRRGHSVRVLAGPFYPSAPASKSLDDSFRASGCEVVTKEAAVWLDGAPGEIIDRSSIPDYLPTVRGAGIWHPLSVPWAVQTRWEIEHFRPAVVLVDLCMPGAGIAAEASQLPYMVLQTSVPVHRLFEGLPVPGRGAPLGEDSPDQRAEFVSVSEQFTLPWLNAARERLGLPEETGPWDWEDRAAKVLVLSSPAFDFRADSYPANLVYVGSMKPVTIGAEWENPWAADDPRSLVVVSSTTTRLAAQWMPVFRAVAEALADTRVRGLMTIGQSIDPGSLPSAENLAYRDYVPHAAVLPVASAIVSQCGHGTTMAALRYGVPLVCVPMFGDQPDVAARVVYHRAGVLRAVTSSAADFRESITAVLEDPQYREAARRLADAMATEDGAVRAAEEVEAVGHLP
jgi:MGT family glycosyltransferase